MDFAVPGDLKVKIKESEKGNKYLDLTRELNKMEHEGDSDTNCNMCAQNNPQIFSKRIRKLRRQIEILQTTTSSRSARTLSPGNLRIITVMSLKCKCGVKNSQGIIIGLGLGLGF